MNIAATTPLWLVWVLIGQVVVVVIGGIVAVIAASYPPNADAEWVAAHIARQRAERYCDIHGDCTETKTSST